MVMPVRLRMSLPAAASISASPPGTDLHGCTAGDRLLHRRYRCGFDSLNDGFVEGASAPMIERRSRSRTSHETLRRVDGGGPENRGVYVMLDGRSPAGRRYTSLFAT